LPREEMIERLRDDGEKREREDNANAFKR